MKKSSVRTPKYIKLNENHHLVPVSSILVFRPFVPYFFSWRISTHCKIAIQKLAPQMNKLRIANYQIKLNKIICIFQF